MTVMLGMTFRKEREKARKKYEHKSPYVKVKVKTKLCLSCDNPFPSEGSTQRMCSPCKRMVKNWDGIND